METLTDLASAPWWLTGLAVVGAIALVTLILNLFFALGRRPQRLGARSIPSVTERDDFLLALAGAVNVPTRAGGTIEILNNGERFYPAILRALEDARISVTFFTYIFEKGEIGDRILEILTERARAGVQVRLLLDGFGAANINREKLEAFEEAGGMARWYRPLRFGKITRFHKRNHRRTIVVDGSVAFTGGAAIADKWRGNGDRPEAWRDSMFQVTGQLARSLQAAFAEAWSNTAGEILVGADFYPFELENGEHAEQAEISRHINLISSPSDEAHPLRKLFWLSFMAAREKLFLTNSYFVPDKHIREALIDRARQGVDVRVLVPNRLTDIKPVWWAGRSYYDELLRSGVRIFEYQPAMMHAKTLVVDGHWSVIGSANMDIRSKELNDENVLGILDEQFGCALEQTFHDDLARSREIRLEEWRRRGLAARLIERFFVLFAEQY